MSQHKQLDNLLASDKGLTSLLYSTLLGEMAERKVRRDELAVTAIINDDLRTDAIREYGYCECLEDLCDYLYRFIKKEQ